MPDGRNEFSQTKRSVRSDSALYKKYGRQALARAANVVRSEAGAGTPNLVCGAAAALASRPASFLKKRYSGKRWPKAMPKISSPNFVAL
jgi:hypothetical protein